MATIKRYTKSGNTTENNSGNGENGNNNENTAPKGSKSNPYTQDEYDAIPLGEWKGGYVEEWGYVPEGGLVDGSLTSDALSESFSDWPSDWNWGEYSHPLSHMGSTPEPGGGGNNGGNDQNPNKPNPDGHTGGGGKPQQPKVSERIKNMIKEASTFSPEISKILHGLMNNGRIIEVNNDEIKGAKWDATAKLLTIGPNANAQNLWHEIVHYHQDSPKNCSHAVREWQAHVITEIMRCCVSPVSFTDMDPKIQIEVQIMERITDYCGLDSQDCPIVDQSIVDFLDTLNYENYVRKAMLYWEDLDKKNDPPLYKGYYDWYDPNYNWNWESIFEKLGIRIRK